MSSDRSTVRVMVGKRGNRRPISGRIVCDERNNISLSSLVPGGDPDVSDKYKRFRDFFRSLDGVTATRSGGTYFHPKHLADFLSRFGDASTGQNEEVIEQVRRWECLDGTSADRPSSPETGTDMREKCKAFAEKVTTCYFECIFPARLRGTEILDRLGFTALHPADTVTARLRRARIALHPDAAHRVPSANSAPAHGERQFAHEQMFKLLARLDAN